MKIPELTFTRGCHLGFKLDTWISHFLVSLKHIFTLIFLYKNLLQQKPTNVGDQSAALESNQLKRGSDILFVCLADSIFVLSLQLTGSI